jgi:ethanolamine ammonia-lyase small subunit
MTHMDDQVAKHIKEIIRRVVRKPSESQQRPTQADTLTQVVQALRRTPDCPDDLMRLARSTWREEGS